MLFCNEIQIGDNLRSIRNERGLTQEQLAEMSDMTTKSYVDFEHGNSSMKVNNFLKVCAALGVTPNDILVKNED